MHRLDQEPPHEMSESSVEEAPRSPSPAPSSGAPELERNDWVELDGPVPDLEKVFKFEDLVPKLATLDPKTKAAELKSLAAELGNEELDVLSERVTVPAVATPEPAFQDMKALRPMSELIETETTHKAALDSFAKLLSHPDLTSRLSKRDKKWLKANIGNLNATSELSGNLINALRTAIGSKAGELPQHAFERQTPDERRQSAENFFRAFHNSGFFSKLPFDSASLVTKSSEWDKFASRNKQALDDVKDELSITPDQKRQLSSGFNYNPANPAFQRAARYPMLLGDLRLPDSFTALHELTKLRSNKAATDFNDLLASNDSQKTRGRGWFDWLLGRR